MLSKANIKSTLVKNKKQSVETKVVKILEGYYAD